MLFQPDMSRSGNGFGTAPGSASGALGQEYLLTADGELSPVSESKKKHGGSGGSTTTTPSSTPAPTLVGKSGGFQIDLIWDSSVAKAPAGFTAAVIAAATYYTTLFSNSMVVNIAVGYGEIGGSALDSGALGESMSYGYLTNYTTVVNALKGDNYAPVTAQNAPTGAQFFVTSAEAKALGLISGSATAIDGYVGFTSAYPMNYSTTGTGTAANQFNMLAIAEHEISEIMGRIGLEGARFNGIPTYTPLDLFNFKSAGVLTLSGSGGYFSVNGGKTNLGTYNNATLNGGDVADWASSKKPTSAYDAYNAFTWPGFNGVVSPSDIVADAAVGYRLTGAGTAIASNAGSPGALLPGHSIAQLVQSMASFGAGDGLVGATPHASESGGLADLLARSAHHHA